MDELTFKEICKCWWSSVIKPAAYKAFKDSFKVKFRGTYQKIIASGIAALYNAFTRNNFSELLEGFKMKVLEIVVVAIGAWLVLSIIECIWRFFYNLLEIPAKFAKEIEGINFQKDQASKVLAAALEIECPNPIEINWNPYIQLGISILESSSRKSVSHEWKFVIHNIKKENVRSLNISWKWNFEIKNLTQLAINLQEFCQNASSDSLELRSEINENQIAIKERKKMADGETSGQKNFFLGSEGIEKLNSVKASGSIEVKLPDCIVDSIIIYCLSLSQINSKNLGSTFINYLLPTITLAISYRLENNQTISQTFTIDGKISVWANGNPVNNLAALLNFDKIDYDKQLIEIKE